MKKKKCPVCHSTRIRTNEKKEKLCNNCGYIWSLSKNTGFKEFKEISTGN